MRMQQAAKAAEEAQAQAKSEGARAEWGKMNAMALAAQASEAAEKVCAYASRTFMEHSLINHHSPLTTHHSLTTQHLPRTAHRSPLTTHHSLLITHHSPLTTHHSPPLTAHRSLGGDTTIYEFEGTLGAKNADTPGEKIMLEQFRGKAILVVNVASF